MTRHNALPKRLFFAALAALSIVSSAEPLLAQTDAEQARSAPLDRRLPMSPNVTTGTLDNGLTYFIRANSEPENRAFLAVANLATTATDQLRLTRDYFDALVAGAAIDLPVAA